MAYSSYLPHFNPASTHSYYGYNTSAGYISIRNAQKLAEAGLLEKLEKLYKGSKKIMEAEAILLKPGEKDMDVAERIRDEAFDDPRNAHGFYTGTLHGFDNSNSDAVKAGKEEAARGWYPPHLNDARQVLGLISLKLQSLSVATSAERTGFGMPGESNLELTIPKEIYQDSSGVVHYSKLVESRYMDRDYLTAAFDNFLAQYGEKMPESRELIDQVKEVLAVKHEKIVDDVKVESTAGKNRFRLIIGRKDGESMSAWKSRIEESMNAFQIWHDWKLETQPATKMGDTVFVEAQNERMADTLRGLVQSTGRKAGRGG